MLVLWRAIQLRLICAVVCCCCLCCDPESLKKWAVNSHNAVWLHIDVAHCGLIAMAAELGFELHHASKETVVMTCWLNTNKANRIPPYASHQVGVCGELRCKVLCVCARNNNFHIVQYAKIIASFNLP